MNHVIDPMKAALLLTNREHLETLVMQVEDLSPGIHDSYIAVGSIQIRADMYESYSISEHGAELWSEVFDAQNAVELSCLAHIARLTINTRRDASELRVVERMRDQLGGYNAAMWSMAVPEPGKRNPSGRVLNWSNEAIQEALSAVNFQ